MVLKFSVIIVKGLALACRLIRGFGIKRVIVAVNKLDEAIQPCCMHSGNAFALLRLSLSLSLSLSDFQTSVKCQGRCANENAYAARFQEVQRSVLYHFSRWGIGAADYSTQTHREHPFAFRCRMRTLLLVAIRLRVVLPKDVKVIFFFVCFLFPPFLLLVSSSFSFLFLILFFD